MSDKLDWKEWTIFVPIVTTTVALAWQIGRLEPTGGFFDFSLSDHLVAAATAIPIAFAFVCFFITIFSMIYQIAKQFPKLRVAIVALLVIAEMITWALMNLNNPSFPVQLSDVLMWAVLAMLTLTLYQGEKPGGSQSGVITTAVMTIIFSMVFSSDLTKRRLREADQHKAPVATVRTKSGTLTGLPIMNGERGLLTYDPSAKTVIFTRADENKTIEQPLQSDRVFGTQ